jgi:hypothetical protein
MEALIGNIAWLAEKTLWLALEGLTGPGHVNNRVNCDVNRMNTLWPR